MRELHVIVAVVQRTGVLVGDSHRGGRADQRFVTIARQFYHYAQHVSFLSNRKHAPRSLIAIGRGYLVALWVKWWRTSRPNLDWRKSAMSLSPVSEPDRMRAGGNSA